MDPPNPPPDRPELEGSPSWQSHGVYGIGIASTGRTGFTERLGPELSSTARADASMIELPPELSPPHASEATRRVASFLGSL